MNSAPNALPLVGREKELELFRNMLDNPDGPWLMWIIGPAGQGKSRLLEAVMAECEDRSPRIRHSQLFDFFDDSLRTRIGAMTELARRFEVEDEPSYKAALQTYQVESAKGDLVDEIVLRYLEMAVEVALIRALCSNYNEAGFPQVIIADTVELIADPQIGLWFFDEFAPKLFPHFFIVAAGRRIPPLKFNAWAGKKPFSVILSDFQGAGDVRDYFVHFFKEPGRLDEIMSSADYEHIYTLTSSNDDQKRGQPLLVALACEAISDGRLSVSEIRSINDFQAFEQELVDRIFDQITELEAVIILELAHIYYGIDPELFVVRYAVRYQSGTLKTNSFEEFVRDRLLVRPYIKYHPTTKVIRLHDYFRDRLNKIDWLNIVGAGQILYRRGMSEELAHQIEQNIQKLKGGGPENSPKLDTAQLRWLYHLLFVDRKRAYGLLWDLFDSSWHSYKFDYMDELLAMVCQVNEILTPVNQFDPILDRIEKSARAWMDLEIWKTDEALALAELVVTDSAGVQRLYLTCLVAKGTALGRLGKVDEGIQALRDALDGYEVLFRLVKDADEGDADAVAKLKTEHGIATTDGIRPERYLILNTIGVLERQRSRFDEAEEAFRKSFELSTLEGDRRWRASAATQLGTIARYKGEMVTAYDFIEMGLLLRRKMNQPGQIAFSLQALGMLQRDVNFLTQARHTFEDAMTSWSQLGSRVHVGNTLRNLGWVDYLEKKYDDAEKRFREAEEIYQNLHIFRELPSLRHKQGALLKAKAEVAANHSKRMAHLAEAEEYLQSGLELGRRHNEPIYIVLCLVDLCDIVQMRGEYARMAELAAEVLSFQKEGYRFGPAYADLERILGDAALRQAHIEDANPDLDMFDKAVDHYCQMYLYLIHHNVNLYRRRRAFLREWLPTLPEYLRQRAADRLIQCWESQPGSLASEHPGLIQTVQLMRDL